MSIYELEALPPFVAESTACSLDKQKPVAYAVAAGGENGELSVYPRTALLPLNGLDPVPFGLVAYASTNLFASLINLSVRGITINNITVGQAIVFGGFGQVLAGIFCGIIGRTQDFAIFISFGSYWIGGALGNIPGTGVQAAYAGSGQLGAAQGVYYMGWAIVTLIYLIGAHRSNIFVVGILFNLMMEYLMAALGEWASNAAIASTFFVASGAFGVMSAICAYYLAVAGLLRADTNIRLPVGDLGIKMD